ncbi:23S rRNA pseudouridine(2604) synthase RluF [Dyadobacter chenhuakuii]|uniref:Pseudouridine synthase n=1 Tax=Dyadobacter chenhuakuii TaxID=2909339 RepID=A0ABY4XQQ7_9BACT|nr:23S rRNA pseudouridine(2604) synthase RluF [Dyadobacter chenhuakuii]MCF2493396.1 23S rRNA pseudouridine(2604) synthase RluF [Dyadobacter chenhuakuii]USJ32327.1 23S rRNA pseudouridine(2604) synthase RluF [Dyadobacter chenhuakuii]
MIRINKYISETGFCSRREADKLVEQGRVMLNGRTAVLGDKASAEDEVKIDGKPLKVRKASVYIAFNKPVGITCTTERDVKGNIIDYIRHPERIFPIGRLDKPSEGLIFLTSDGDIVNKILRAGNNHEKEYVVTVDKQITPEFVAKMSAGVPVLGTITKKCYVKKEGSHVFTIILTQGLNRQIRRMCEYLGYRVTKLKRVRIMNVTLDDLPTGKWRNLTAEELQTINAAVESSVKTEEGSYLSGWEE